MVSRGEAIGAVVLSEVVVGGAVVLLLSPIEDVFWILPVVALFAAALGGFVLRVTGVIGADN